jgi:nucleoid DNA-binding protein
MNLREWARMTQRALREQPPEERIEISIDRVEQVLRMSIATLANALVDGEDLRTVQLGQIWVEERPPRTIAGNLNARAKMYNIGARKTVRLKASDLLVNILNSSHAKRDRATARSTR